MRLVGDAEIVGGEFRDAGEFLAAEGGRFRCGGEFAQLRFLVDIRQAAGDAIVGQQPLQSGLAQRPVGPGRTLGQAALQWLLADPRIACCLPNIYDEAQLREFAAAPESPALTREELDRVAELAANNFGVEGETPNYKGTMTRETAAV